MSKFAGTWHYASQTADGDPVVRNKETITVTDDGNGTPSWVEIKLSDQTSPVLPVDDEKTASDISFTKTEKEKVILRGRLVILSAAESGPAILIGSIHQPRPPASGGEPQGQVEDHNIDVFIAVKTG